MQQGQKYYYSFLEKFPDIHRLAEAKLEEVHRIWQGLGYYRRAGNMHSTAKFLVQNKDGDFPQTYNELLQLKGIGPYIAAAIASFCFDIAVPVMDANVERFLSRYFGMELAVNTSAGKKKLRFHLNAVFDKKQPARFNQAVMEFGALHCTKSSVRNAVTAPLPRPVPHSGKRKQIYIPIKKRKVLPESGTCIML